MPRGNLFDNGFSSVLAAVAYTGVVSDQRGLTPATPELTTNGNLCKAWRIEEDGRAPPVQGQLR